MSIADNFTDASDQPRHDSPGFAADVESLKKSFSQLRADLMQTIERALVAGKSGAHATVGGVKDAAANVKDAAVGMKDAAVDAATGIKDKGVDSAKAVEEHIAEHPIASTVIAFCAGYVIGKMFSRR